MSEYSPQVSAPILESQRRSPVTWTKVLAAAALLVVSALGSAATLTTTSSCTCTPTLFKTCSATTTTTAANCKTYSSGSTSVNNTGKSLVPNLDLQCQMTGVPIEATDGGGLDNLGTPDINEALPNLVIGGAAGAKVWCKEVAPGAGPDAPAQTVDDGSGPQSLEGFFSLQQTVTLNDCVSYAATASPASKTWTCGIAGVEPVNATYIGTDPECESECAPVPYPNADYAPPADFAPIHWTLTPTPGDTADLFCRADPSKPISTPANPPIAPYNPRLPSCGSPFGSRF